MYLYIHIPYCLSKCDYCDFFSVPCNTGIPNDYIDSVVAEVAVRAGENSVASWDSIYVGGGTPSLLKPSQLTDLVNGIKQQAPVDACAEITVEMNPETVTSGLILAAKECGVNRISLGIQSLSDGALHAVHRHCSAQRALEALELLSTEWSGELSVDVIAGLPGQTPEEYLATIKNLLKYKPGHFSLYTLTVEEGTPFAKRVSSKSDWDYDEADRLWIAGRDLLEENGLKQYEVSNFSLPGHEAKHNSAYWKQDDYIGCGAGACGTVYGFAKTGGVRWTNTTDIQAYCEYWKQGRGAIPQQMELLGLETEEFEFFMMGLRTRDGINQTQYEKRYASLAPFYGDLEARLESSGSKWAEYKAKGYAEVYKNRQSENCYRLSHAGILFLNDLLRSLV